MAIAETVVLGFLVMEITLNHSILQLMPYVPAGWEAIRIKGGTVDAWEGKEGTIMIETVSVGMFLITVIRIFSQSIERIEWSLQNVEYGFFYCLEGAWQIEDHLHQSVYQKNQYQLLQGNRIQLIPSQKQGAMHQLLLIERKMNEPLVKPGSLIYPLNATTILTDLVTQLTHSVYFPRPKPFHEQLIRSIVNHAEEIKNSNLFKNEEIEQLYKVSALIEKDLQQHHSIEALAVYSGMNRQQLTAGFKSLFGQTIYAFYISKCMALAKLLLCNSNLPVKQIAKKTGYRNATNFSIAFKRFYKITPGQMRSRKPD